MTTEARPLAHSTALWDRASIRAPGGVHSNVRLMGPKVFIERGKGAWIYDVDGTDYVDYLLGQGPNFLGHAPEPVVQAVEAATRGGMIYGGQHPLEVEAAELACQALDWPAMVRFGVSGTESVQAALRAARAATGRTKIIRFEGHYHGWLDNVLIANQRGKWGPGSVGQLSGPLDDLIVLPWNDADIVRDALDRFGEDVAAVIMEPMMINSGAIKPLPGYLEAVRALCDEYSTVLIFDEVISGFRLATGGAAERFGVTPDLATYGKALAGGWPVSMLAGRADLMERFGTGEVNHSGTFNASVMAMAATVATLTVLMEDPPYERVVKHGAELMTAIHRLGESRGLPLHVQGLPMAFHVSFGEEDAFDYRSLGRLDLARYATLAETLVEHGVWVSGRGVWFVSAAHGQGELDTAVTRFDDALTHWSR